MIGNEYLKHKNTPITHKMSFVISLLLIIFSPIFTFKTAYLSSFIVAMGEIVVIFCYVDKFRVKLNFVEVKKEFVFLFVFTVGILVSSFKAVIENDYFLVEIYITILRTIFIIIHISFSVVLIRYIFRFDFINALFFILPITISVYVLGVILYYNLSFFEMLNNEYAGLPFVQNRRFIGYLAMLSAIILSCYMLYLPSKINKITLAIFIFALISVSFLFWLGGRGAILSFFISLSLFTLLQRIKLTNRISKANSVLFLNTVLLSVFFSEYLSVFDWNGVFRLSIDASEKTLDEYSSNRITIWLNTIDYIIDKVWFGYGADSYLILNLSGHYHPHNFILQMLLEFGLFGFLPFTLLYLTIAIKSYNYTIKNKVGIQYDICIVLVLSLFLHGMLDGTLYHATPVMFLTILTSYLIYERNTIKAG
ncbi:O-antigen ligase family protein [Vibrio breoganii]|uniref:O-antigen ligase family protein n=1 Tax=Vibrio breoganii TaxID=553239 RepID=UPI0012FFFBAD|nr:O-antigen ligase family protein [Vibrio breoganii]